MTINISNILAQLNTKMTTDSSSTTTELLRRVKAYNDLNNAGRVFEYQYYNDLPAVDSSNIGQLAYVRSSLDDSFGTFFFAKALANDSGYLSAIDSTNSGWQKIVLNANDSDNFADIVAIVPYSFQGSVSGYLSGGAPPQTDVIQKFSFTSDGNATDVGDLIQPTNGAAGQSSSTHGYSSGGVGPTSSPAITGLDPIQKYLFAVNANATDVGDLTVARWNLTGQSSSISGYSSGGQNTNSDTIDKFPFSTDANATDVGNLTAIRRTHAGQSSTDNGYVSGGTTPAGGTYSNNIEKFPFTVDANATDVGDLTVGRETIHGGQSSNISGYTTGGKDTGITVTNIIDKFSFATDGNATDVGDLSVTRHNVCGNSSTTSGYTAGGFTPPTLRSNVIDKFPFATDANATDVGNLLSALEKGAGTQV